MQNFTNVANNESHLSYYLYNAYSPLKSVSKKHLRNAAENFITAAVPLVDAETNKPYRHRLSNVNNQSLIENKIQE